jgi:hypothetical protein
MKRLAAGFSLLSLPILLLLAPHTGYGQTTSDATPTLVVAVAAEMEPVPSNCGVLAEPLAIDPLIPQAIGTWPIWIALPNGGDEATGTLYLPNRHDQVNPNLEGWWATKVAWFIPINYRGDVHLQGVNITDQSPMYFEFNEEGPLEVATINPEQPGGFVEELDRWAFFPSYVWVSKAGCYQLEADWEGGSWQQGIAVGRSG